MNRELAAKLRRKLSLTSWSIILYDSQYNLYLTLMRNLWETQDTTSDLAIMKLAGLPKKGSL